jgi:hypothetical protein
MWARMVVCLAIVGLVAAPQATAADRVVERGIVQSITPSAVVLRALDGVDVQVAIGPGTRIRLNGRPARLADIRPGFVAETVRRGARPALRLRAFGRVAPVTEQGRILAVRDTALVLRIAAGHVRIPLAATTVVRRQGRLVALRNLRVGMRVGVTRADDGSAAVVRVLRAGA